VPPKNPFLQNPSRYLRSSTRYVTNKGTLVLYVRIQAYVLIVKGLGMLHPTPFVGDAGVHRKVVVQIERSFETITPGALRIVYHGCGTVSTCQQKKI
jgi:hypothetical protein